MELKLNFIAVNKVIKDKRGQLLAEPEMIRLDEIKSFREWHKTDDEKIAFKEDFTIVYMRDKNADGKIEVKPIKILEKQSSFAERVGTIQFGFKGEVKVHS
jgi:hypothetical protein